MIFLSRKGTNKNKRLNRESRVGRTVGLVLLLALVKMLAAGQSTSLKQVQILHPNELLQRELTGQEIHRYSFTLREKEFFQVRLEQKGVDVVLRLGDSKGNVLATMDTPNGNEGPETLSLVAPKGGTYQLEIRSIDSRSEKGIYIIKREPSHAATRNDRKRVEAERLFMEGIRARDSESLKETAIAKLEQAKRGWLDLKDDYLAQLTDRQIEQIKNNEDRSSSRKLSFGQTMSYQLKGGEVHFYYVDLKQGETLRIDVQENGVDVRIVLIRIEDQAVLEKSDFGFGHDRETLTTIVEKTARYAVLVGATESSLTGTYALMAQVRETATDADRKQIKAARLLANGLASRRKGSAEDLRGAIAKWEEALVLWNALEEKYWEGYTCNSLGRAYMGLGQLPKALIYLNRALALRRVTDDRSGEAQTLNNIGSVYDELGERPKALDYYNQDLQIFKMIGDRDGEANTLSNIGQTYVALGEHQLALHSLEQAIKLRMALKDRRGEAQTLNLIAKIYDDLGEKQRALDCLQRALPLARAIGDTSIETNILNNIGRVYAGLGAFEKALDYYNRALPLSRAIGDKATEANALSNIGSIYRELGEAQKSLDYYDRALVLSHIVGNLGEEAAILNNIGLAYSDLREQSKALTYYDKAWPIFKTLGDRTGTAAVLNNVGTVYAALGEEQKALDNYNQALLLSSIIGDRNAESKTLKNIGRVWESLHNWRMAIFYTKLSVNKDQELRAGSWGLDNEIQKSFLRGFQDTYRRLAELLIQDGQFVQAIEVLNSYQDQQFFDFDRDPKAPLRLTPFSLREQSFASRYDNESENIRKLSSRIEDIKRQSSKSQGDEREADQLSQLQVDLNRASNSFLDVLKDAERQFAAAPNETKTIAILPEVNAMQLTLHTLSTTTKDKAVILYTLVGRDEFHVFLITPEGRISHFESPVKAADFNEKILQFQAVLQSPKYDPRPLGKELYDIVFRPVEAELKKMDAKTLMWSLDGRLAHVPMAALWDGEKYLVERYQNVVFTRADPERMTRNVSQHWTGTGFGGSKSQTVDMHNGDKMLFPALPGVTVELEQIFKTRPASQTGILTGEVFADKNFNKRLFFEALKEHRPVVHIASHFRFRPGDELNSFLLLGDGTTLTLNEMKQVRQLFHGVELLVVSGGDTATTRPDATGKEIDGFAELAQRLGAASVIATLWCVSDASTPWIMRDFYSIREKNGTTKAEALRQAQLGLLNGTITNPLREAARSGGLSEVKLVVTSDKSTPTRTDEKTAQVESVFVSGRVAPPFKSEALKPFAHPYYWAPFVLIGNWK